MIVEAASRLFLEHGYHATSIGRIASEAGVAVQTIYNAVGSKRDLLSRVLDFAAAGERSPVPVDRAIAATRSAAKSNPNDPDAVEFMFAAYQSKLDLLNQVADARLSNRPH